MECAEVVFIVHYFRLRRILAREQRRPRWITKRILRVGTIESDSTRRKFVEVRCLYDLVTVSTKYCPQIIRGDHNYVVTRLLRRSAAARAREESSLRRNYRQAQANR